MDFENVEKTAHYRKEHESDVPWDTVLRMVFTTKRKRIGEHLYSFTTKEYYVLANLEGRTLKIVNAKRRKSQ